MDNLIKIEKKQFNILRKKFNKLIKNISNLPSEKLNINIIKQLNLVNNNIECLINTIDLCNNELTNKNSNNNISKELKQKIDRDVEINKIIQLFLPFMFLYQINNSIK